MPFRVNDLAEGSESDSNDKISHFSTERQESAIKRLYDIERDGKNHGRALLCQQFKAMIIKRISYYKRKWTIFIPQLLIPILYVSLFVWMIKLFPTAKEQSPLVIDMSPYDSQGKPAHMFYSDSPMFKTIKDEINATVHKWTKDLNLNLENLPRDDMNRDVIKAIKQAGTRAFGLHNPVAIKSSGVKDPFTGITAMFNNFALHSPPLALALAGNCIYA